MGTPMKNNPNGSHALWNDSNTVSKHAFSSFGGLEESVSRIHGRISQTNYQILLYLRSRWCNSARGEFLHSCWSSDRISYSIEFHRRALYDIQENQRCILLPSSLCHATSCSAQLQLIIYSHSGVRGLKLQSTNKIYKKLLDSFCWMLWTCEIHTCVHTFPLVFFK